LFPHDVSQLRKTQQSTKWDKLSVLHGWFFSGIIDGSAEISNIWFAVAYCINMLGKRICLVVLGNR